MKLTRRALAVAALAPAALAQTPAGAPQDDLKAVRDRIKANADVLAKQDLPMSTEPAFQFKA